MNADSAIINEDTYHAIQDVFEQLSPDNQQIFYTAVNESAESFERILNFVVATYEEE
jgi:TRAP-type C4-dicarboxylate transport system substrate-binding protein